MPFKPPRKQPQFADLKGVLSQSGKTDNALSQTVAILIDRLTQFQGITVEDMGGVQKQLNAIGGALKGGLDVKHYDTPLTDGDVDETNLIFANGECIIVQVPT